jgi:hypothetical protein
MPERKRGNHENLAKDLDHMEEDVTPWEADFLDSILKILSRGGTLSPKQAERLEGMHEKYLGSDTGLIDRQGEPDWL